MIDFNSDYQREVFREAYNEGKREGKKDERKRILKLIDEKIQHYNKTYKTSTIANWLDNPVKIEALEQLKEELK